MPLIDADKLKKDLTYSICGINYANIRAMISAQPTIDPVHAAGACYCRECMFAREKYGKLECINGISYRNKYNDPKMFCSYGKPKEEYDE